MALHCMRVSVFLMLLFATVGACSAETTTVVIAGSPDVRGAISDYDVFVVSSYQEKWKQRLLALQLSYSALLGKQEVGDASKSAEVIQ